MNREFGSARLVRVHGIDTNETNTFIYQVLGYFASYEGMIIERLRSSRLIPVGIEENDGIFLNLLIIRHHVFHGDLFIFFFIGHTDYHCFPKEEIQLHFVDGIAVISKVIWSIYMGSCLSSHINTGKIVIIFFNCMCCCYFWFRVSRINRTIIRYFP